MATQYYFAHGVNEHGPFSAGEMLGLATAGKIEPTDRVWRLGIGRDIPAARVKFLFQSPASTSVAADAPSLPVETKAVTPLVAAEVFVPPAEKPRVRQAECDRPRRVATIKGGVLVSQDGRQVQFRKKCPTCGTEDQCRSTTVIRPGAMKVPYFCRKCRKGRTVEMMGVS